MIVEGPRSFQDNYTPGNSKMHFSSNIIPVESDFDTKHLFFQLLYSVYLLAPRSVWFLMKNNVQWCIMLLMPCAWLQSVITNLWKWTLRIPTTSLTFDFGRLERWLPSTDHGDELCICFAEQKTILLFMQYYVSLSDSTSRGSIYLPGPGVHLVHWIHCKTMFFSPIIFLETNIHFSGGCH